MKNLSTKTIGILLVLSSFSIFAIADVTVKSTSMQMNALTVAFYMNIFTTLFLLPVVFLKGGFRKVLKTNSLKIHFLRAMFMLCNFLCFIYALGKMPIATFYVIIFMMPFVINILAWLILKEHISLYRWLAIFVAIIGVIIALRPDTIPLTIPVLVAFSSCFFNGSATISVKFIDKKDHWLSYTLYLMLFQTPIIMALMLVKGLPLMPEMSHSLLLWFIGGGLAYAIALTLLPQAIQRVDASLVGALIYTVFPWGVFYGFFIFGDAPDHWTLLGAVIIIASGLFLIYREQKENSKLME